MVVCLDKGSGAAATVASITYKGASALDMALWMRSTTVSQYLQVDLGMEATNMDDSDVTGLIVDELGSLFSHHLSVGVLIPEGQFSWELLPGDLVERIACSFSSAEIYITVKSVCKKWFDALSQMPQPLALLPSTQIPFLLLPPLEFGLPYKGWKVRNTNTPSHDSHFAHLSLTAGKVVVGSSFGWVHVFDSCSFSLFILNPVTGERIGLPSMLAHCSASIEPTMLVQHAVLSDNPSISSSWVLLVFLTAELTGCLTYRHGDISWTEHTYDEFSVEDVVCFRDRFVALDAMGRVGLFDIMSDEPNIEFTIFQEELALGSHHLLVSPSQEDLLMVTTATFDNPMLSEGHSPLIEKLFISAYFVKRKPYDLACLGPTFLGHSCSIAVNVACVPPSFRMGVYKAQTCCCLMGVKGRTLCGCVVRSALEIGKCTHDITHCQLFPRNDVWSSMRPWWVIPNIFKVGTIRSDLWQHP